MSNKQVVHRRWNLPRQQYPANTRHTRRQSLHPNNVYPGDIVFLPGRDQFPEDSCIWQREKAAGDPFQHSVVIASKEETYAWVYCITAFTRRDSDGRKWMGLHDKYPGSNRWGQHERYIPIVSYGMAPSREHANKSYPNEWISFSARSPNLPEDSYIIADRTFKVELRHLRPHFKGDVRIDHVDLTWLRDLNIWRSDPSNDRGYRGECPGTRPTHSDRKPLSSSLADLPAPRQPEPQWPAGQYTSAPSRYPSSSKRRWDSYIPPARN